MTYLWTGAAPEVQDKVLGEDGDVRNLQGQLPGRVPDVGQGE